MTKINEALCSFPWSDPHCYTQWLRDTHEYVLNSTRILAYAAAVMPQKYTTLSNRFVAHATEEKGHEKLLENDLKALDLKVSDIPPTNAMKFFHQSLYYWLSHQGNVVGLFGWIFALEGAAVRSGEYAYNHAREAHGPKAASFLKVHSNEDPDHLEKAFKMIDVLSPEDQHVVELALDQYADLYISILQNISQKDNHQLAKTA